MNLLLPADIESLVEVRRGPCLSFYFPAFPPGARTRQGAIRLQALLGEAGEELRARGLEETAVETLLRPLKDLLTDLSFWNAREEGIALFRSPGFLQAFHLACAFPERWFIGKRFFLKPLLPLVAGDHPFLAMALSQREVRLLEVTGQTVRRLEPPGLPAGQGDRKEEPHRFFRQVESAFRKLLAGRTAPLVLAGAEPLPAIYREISGYPHLAAVVIHGNPEDWTDEELRDRAWRLLEPTFQETRRRTAERFGELTGTGRVSSDVTEILPAARQGRVETLFLACDTDVWGRLDPVENVVVHPASEEGDEELLDAAALFSLRHGGMVYGLGRGEIPGGGDLAAVFRY